MEASREKYIEFLNRASMLTLSIVSKNKEDIFYEILKNIQGINEQCYEDIINLLIERENAGSTIIAPKIVLAHIETDLVDEMVFACAFSNEGIYNWAFDEINEEVKVVFLILFPEKVYKKIYIDIVKKLMIQLSNDEDLKSIANAKDHNEIRVILTKN